MNEHDSERISGILESSGMSRTQEVADADVRIRVLRLEVELRLELQVHRARDDEPYDVPQPQPQRVEQAQEERPAGDLDHGLRRRVASVVPCVTKPSLL